MHVYTGTHGYIHRHMCTQMHACRHVNTGTPCAFLCLPLLLQAGAAERTEAPGHQALGRAGQPLPAAQRETDSREGLLAGRQTLPLRRALLAFSLVQRLLFGRWDASLVAKGASTPVPGGHLQLA